MTIKAIFFDNDGVLVDTEKYYFESNHEIFREHNLPHSLEIYLEYALFSKNGTNGFLKENGLNDEQIKKIRKERDLLFEQKIKNKNHLMPSVSESIESLSKNYDIGIVTSSNRAQFAEIHKKSGICGYFKFILTRYDYKKTKPDPSGYQSAIKLSGLKPEECIVVEDSPRGIKAAQAAGLRCIAIKSKYSDKIDTSMADYQINNLSELSDLIIQIS